MQTCTFVLFSYVVQSLVEFGRVRVCWAGLRSNLLAHAANMTVFSIDLRNNNPDIIYEDVETVNVNCSL